MSNHQTPADNTPANNTPVDPAIVAQAINWQVQLADSANPPDEAGLQQWLAADPEHRRAWQQLQAMGQALGQSMQQLRGTVPPALARQALDAAQADLKTRKQRRTVLRSITALSTTGLTGWLAHQHTPLPMQLAAWRSDFSTAAGEQRAIILADGTELRLNTATSIKLRETATATAIQLQHGEIMVQTASTSRRAPVWVHTPSGLLEPLGTRFHVLHTPASGLLDAGADGRKRGATRVAVQQGAVRISAGAHSAEQATSAIRQIVRAGDQAWFDAASIQPAEAVGAGSTAWASGMFVAERMRLDALATELGRYRSGRVLCAPEVAHLRITGAWPLQAADATDRILASVATSLPVRIEHRTRWWVRMVPA